jgi:hypothetical protein
MFSMTFFNWNSSGGNAGMIAPQIWIYVVASVILTALTVGLWYIYLSSRKRAGDEDMVGTNIDEKAFTSDVV